MKAFQNNSRLRFVFGVITASLLIMIFVFSSDSGNDSGDKSTPIAEALLNSIDQRYDARLPVEKSAMREITSFFIRKLAHLSEYLLLGCFMTLFFETLPIRRPLLSSGVLCALYACTDELHQLFVPGRSAQVRDVAIDISGVLLGVALAYSIVLLCVVHWQRGREGTDV